MGAARVTDTSVDVSPDDVAEAWFRHRFLSLIGDAFSRAEIRQTVPRGLPVNSLADELAGRRDELSDLVGDVRAEVITAARELETHRSGVPALERPTMNVYRGLAAYAAHTGVVLTALLAAVWLWEPAVDAIGRGWTIAVWLVTGVAALVASIAFYEAAAKAFGVQQAGERGEKTSGFQDRSIHTLFGSLLGASYVALLAAAPDAPFREAVRATAEHQVVAYVSLFVLIAGTMRLFRWMGSPGSRLAPLPPHLHGAAQLVVRIYRGPGRDPHDLMPWSLFWVWFPLATASVVAFLTVTASIEVTGTAVVALASAVAALLTVSVIHVLQVLRTTTHPDWPQHVSPEWRARDEDLVAQLIEAQARWSDALLNRALLPALRRRINEIVRPPDPTRLSIHSAPGLDPANEEEYLINTPAFDHLRSALQYLSVGALGVAGPRGAGKSTLLRAYTAGQFTEAGSIPPVTVKEDAPVQYDARDFVLHLYAKVCERLVQSESQTMAAYRHNARRQMRLFRGYVLLALPAAALAMLATYRLTWLTSALDIAGTWGVRHWGVGVALAAVAGGWFLRSRRVRLAADHRGRVIDGFSSTSQSFRRMPDEHIARLSQHAARKLTDIRFQQRYTTGWSGKITMPLGAELSGSRSVARERNTMSYPEVVADFRQFLEVALGVLAQQPGATRTPLAIVIDELDKISSAEAAERFINEIKSLFGVRQRDGAGCLFLVSVSEDALASFERRGLPIRDAFDSAFDDILHVDYLTLEESTDLLNSRVIGMSEAFVGLCHCLASGLPRELVRTARQIVNLPSSSRGDTTLTEACRNLVANDVRRMASAMRRTVASHPARSASTSELLRRLESAQRTPLTADKLLEIAAKPLPELPGTPHPWMHISAYLYFCATVVEVFTNETTADNLPHGHDSRFDVLASARQLLAVDPLLAWEACSDARHASGLRTYPSPIRPHGEGLGEATMGLASVTAQPPPD